MSDKRKISTDALETLGMIISDGEKRDAIHLAVEPVEAAVKLYAGQDVGLVDGKAVLAIAGVKPLGIVDPFLKEPVFPGQRFWLVVYPRQIQSLRHVWTHPDFESEAGVSVEPPSKKRSEKWLRDFTATADCPGYEAVMAEVKSVLAGGGTSWSDEYLHFSGRDAHGEIPPEFWDHAEVVLGVQIPSDKRPQYFSCGC